MPIPATGAVSINIINNEFGRGNNLNAYRGTSYYRSSDGAFLTFSSGAITMNDFRGTQLNDPTPPPPPPPPPGP